MKRSNFNIIRNFLCCILAFAMAFTTLSSAVVAGAANDSFETQLTAQGFPESYKTYLRTLHQKYPNWKFTALHTNLSWNEVIKNEGKCGRNLIPSSAKDAWKCKDSCCYKNGQYVIKESGGWVCASDAAIGNYMDPRNYLDEKSVFQFENLGYNAAYQTIAGVEGILKGTFMSNTKISYKNAQGQTVNTNDTYASVIMEAAKQSGASAYYIASKIRQEIGTTPSPSVTGTFSGYKGIYNFYNINAGSGSTPIANALKWASSTTGGTYGRPWNTPQKSIIGGAKYIANYYINEGQNTGYLQKFNVVPNDEAQMYWHQYMSNVAAAVSEASSTYRAYQSLGTLSLEKEFLIPVYSGMPNMSESTSATVKINNVTNKPGVCNGNYVNIRTGAGTSYSVLKVNSKDVQLVKGNQVQILEEIKTSNSTNPVWYKISFIFSGSVRTGYISARYVTPDANKTLGIGEKLQLDVTKTPANSLATIKYSSSNSSVAAVDAQGLITAKGKGTATITAESSSGSRDSMVISVVPAPSALYLNASSVSLKAKETFQLSSTLNSGAAATDRFYSSSNSGVATVNDKGVITAVSGGTAVITVKTYNGVSSKCTVTVTGDTFTISVSPKTALLTVGQSLALSAVTTPNAQASVAWKSSNPSIVSVSADGILTANGEGNATITATSNGVSATCAVTVKATTQSVLLSKDASSLGVGETDTLSVQMVPANSGTVVWKSSNLSVAEISSSGKITAKAVGTATITATVNGVSDTCTVTVGPAPSSVTLNSSSASLNVGERLDVGGKINPGAISNSKLTYTSSNTQVATVASNGIVTATGVGTTSITVKTYNGKTAVCTITVRGNTQSISLTPSSMIMGLGEKETLRYTIVPANSGAVSFSSNNNSVATVSSDGTVTAKGLGTATIRATCNGKTATCEITVRNVPTSVWLNYTTATLKIGQTIDLNSDVPKGTGAYRRDYTSDNPSVAEVTFGNGYVTGKKAGTATITVRLFNGKTATCRVTVVDGSSNTPGTVTGSWVNIRTDAGTNYPNVRVNGNAVTLTKGTKVTILSQKSSNYPSKSIWYRINFTVSGKTYTGYIISTYCKPVSSATTGTLTGDYVNVRSGPGTNYSILRSGNTNIMLRKGAKVTILDKQSGQFPQNSLWCKVSFSYNGDTKIGYVITTYIK